MSFVAATTRKRALIGTRHGEPQQFGQCGCSGVMHRRTHRHLDGFEIQPPCLAAAVKDDAQ
jgi:hypothetical protein